jgi:hypothetical protein
VSGTLSLFPEAQWPEVGGQRVPAPLTSESGAAYQGDRVLFADATGTPDGHALVARAVASLNARAVASLNACAGIKDPVAALAEVRAILTRLASCYEQDCTCGAPAARAALALGPPGAK